MLTTIHIARPMLKDLKRPQMSLKQLKQMDNQKKNKNVPKAGSLRENNEINDQNLDEISDSKDKNGFSCAKSL